MPGLFFDDDEPARYPEAPGFKKRDTCKAAAEGIASKAGSLRDRVLAEIKHYPGSPEQIAQRLKEPLMNVRPRLSELSAKNLVRDSGRRALAHGGRQAIVWEAVECPRTSTTTEPAE